MYLYLPSRMGPSSMDENTYFVATAEGSDDLYPVTFARPEPMFFKPDLFPLVLSRYIDVRRKLIHGDRSFMERASIHL